MEPAEPERFGTLQEPNQTIAFTIDSRVIELARKGLVSYLDIFFRNRLPFSFLGRLSEKPVMGYKISCRPKDGYIA